MTLRCRKNQASLTDDERTRFVAAMLAVKASGKYDQYVNDHMISMNAAHQGPAFLPWHREFLRRLELDLQAVDASVTLPYWDWTVDQSPTSRLWDIDFMGGDGRPSDGRVMTGLFAFSTGAWTLVYDGPALRRRIGQSPSAPTLPTTADVTNAMAETRYDVPPYTSASGSGFRNRLEGWIAGPQLHNRVHVWVGGSMSPMSSPNDPVFFLHHCFIDKLWADWQRLRPGVPYEPIAGIPGRPGHALHETMEPWASRGENVTPANVLDHHALGYAYDNELECRPTLKFSDDIVTLKFRDDTLKFHDDIKLKFRDDITTLKFRDDNTTLKFRDDLGTDPRIDLLKQPVRDKPPLVDAGKQPSLDNMAGSDLGSGLDPAQSRASTPFVLATPHHSMAWAEAAGGAETMLAEREHQLEQLALADERGQLSPAERQQAEQLFAEYQALIQELRR